MVSRAGANPHSWGPGWALLGLISRRSWSGGTIRMWPRSTQRLKAARKSKVRVRVQGCGAHCTGSTALPIEGCWVFLYPNFAEEGAGRRVLVSAGGEGEDAWVAPGSCQLGPRRARVV